MLIGGGAEVAQSLSDQETNTGPPVWVGGWFGER